jgi:hypothetical protein
MTDNKAGESRISEASHLHKDGGRKIGTKTLKGVNIVRDPRTGESKIAVTRKGAERLAKELG